MPGLLTDGTYPKAPVVIGPTTKNATRPTNVLPQYLSDQAKLTVQEEFNAAKHIEFEHPTSRVMMKDIGLEGHGISPVAVSEPFPLFSAEAIDQFRAEIFSDATMTDCQYASDFNKNMVRGMGPV